MALFTMRDSWNVWRRKVNEAIGGSVEPVKSEDVTYDNTDSGLTATNVQSAIDEVAGTISDLDGADIGYDGTTSGLSATNVQSAIDEVNTAVTTLENKKYKTTTLFSGDASAGGADGVTVTVDDVTKYDELLISYNYGLMCSSIPVPFLKIKNTPTLQMQYIDNGTSKLSSVTYVNDQTLKVSAPQGSTFYLIGIQYNA